MMMMMNYILKDASTSNSLSMINLIIFLLVSTMLSQASADSEICNFEHGLGTTLCPWHNVEGVDDDDWTLSDYPYHFKRSTFGRNLYSRGQYYSQGKAWLVGNYRNNSVTCFSFSYYLQYKLSVYWTLNIYQEYFYNRYMLLLWSLNDDKESESYKWKKGQVTVDFTMGLSRLIIESDHRRGATLANLTFYSKRCDTIPKVATPSSALDCSIGSFFSLQLNKCEKCPTSTYQPYANQTRCLTCNDGKGTINVGAVSEQECIKVESCDFQKGMGTNVCPWHNVYWDDVINWKLTPPYLDFLGYDATGSSIGRYVSADIRYISPGKTWLVGNYRRDSLVCFSFSYYMYRTYSGILNIYQEYFHNGYSPLLWSLSGDQGNKWNKGQVTVNFTMGLSRLVIEDVLESSYFRVKALDNLAFTPGSCEKIPEVAFRPIAFDCSVGSFFSFESMKCEKCPIYTYQPYTNQTRCLACNDGKGTINVGAISERECIKVESCDFQKGLETTDCPWRNERVDDHFDWKLSTSNLYYWQPPRYDALGLSIGKMAVFIVNKCCMYNCLKCKK
ncbi:MAM and LDL-receptor class A domain-containing protein 1-like [Xenia sp. Carnegie-2017]|uniref:MAM and LDL-receptor class A domain-containing protein 1-like n=1 Tax=Xenia sp. Carnegie-2017 TaxID=2897299 RepID=UPI001F042CD7|nr:MAM and LDL-receptor class A domain-containing protein 1-like [Xenia sp. Carnegie-2017]